MKAERITRSKRGEVLQFVRASSSAVEQGTLNHTATARIPRSQNGAITSGRPPSPSASSAESPVRPLPLYVQRARRIIDEIAPCLNCGGQTYHLGYSTVRELCHSCGSEIGKKTKQRDPDAARRARGRCGMCGAA